MANQDHQIAMDLSRSFNGTTRRVSPRLAEAEMRAAKRPRIDNDIAPLTPQSTPQSYSGQFMGDQSNALKEAVFEPVPEKVVPLTRATYNQMPASLSSAIEAQSTRPTTRKQRGKKQDEDDDEFSPDQDVQNSPEDFQLRKTTRRSKTAGKRKATSSKTPTAPYHINNQVGKPEPHGQPIVWANKRQQLCETVPYYNAYQGSAYTNQGIVYAVLVDKEVSVRDKFEEEIIITSLLV
jgi:hypothetical protein